MSTKVSIIIPVYNVAPYVEECIRSVMNQTMTEGVECIIVDDCGQDNSMEIVEDILAKQLYKKSEDGTFTSNLSPLTFLILHHDHNRGLSAARNTGIKVAKGKYLGFVDSDDWIEPTMYEELFNIMEDNPALQFVTTPVVSVSEESKTLKYNNRTKMYPELGLCSVENYLRLLLSYKIDSLAWNKLIRREYAMTLFPEGINCEDYFFHYFNCKRIINNKDSKILFLDYPCYHYRTRSGSIINTTLSSPDQWYMDFFRISLIILEDTKRWNLELYQLQVETTRKLYYRYFYEMIGNHKLISKFRKVLRGINSYIKGFSTHNVATSMKRDVCIAQNIPYGFDLLYYYKKLRKGMFLRQ